MFIVRTLPERSLRTGNHFQSHCKSVNRFSRPVKFSPPVHKPDNVTAGRLKSFKTKKEVNNAEESRVKLRKVLPDKVAERLFEKASPPFRLLGS